MNRALPYHFSAIPLLFLLGAQSVPPAVAPPPASRPSPTPFPTWLIGQWEEPSARGVSRETWSPETDGIMSGVGSHPGRQGEIREVLRIERNPAGKLVYVAKPAGQAETPFTEAEARETFLAFENPAHDFPQRITYELLPDGRLKAEISGTLQGKLRSRAWVFTKVAAPATRP